MDKKKKIISIFVGLIFIIIIYNFYTTFSLGTDYKFESRVYNITEGFINNISPNTNISTFIDNLDTENCTISIEYNNNILSEGYVPNESITRVKKNNQTIASYTNIILGDITRDGKVEDFDLTEFGKYLVNKNNISPELQKSLDIDGRDGIHLNDLMLLEKNMKSDYQSLDLSENNIIIQSNEKKRIIASILPSQGKNTNAKWKSNNDNIATVNNSGIITGKNVGTTTIEVATIDEKIKKTITVTVDNTIQLSSETGNVYIEGEELAVDIKSVDYNNITCTSSVPSRVTCRIENKKLYLRAVEEGRSTITVSSPTYGSKQFAANSISTYINLSFFDYACLNPGKTGNLIISTMNAGTLSFNISDEEIVNNVHVDGSRFYFTAGNKVGRGTVIIKGSNSNRTKTFTLDVYKLSLPDRGIVLTPGQDITEAITAEGTGELTCKSKDESVVTCQIEEKNLYVHAKAAGYTEIEVNNTLQYNNEPQKCGPVILQVLVR